VSAGWEKNGRKSGRALRASLTPRPLLHLTGVKAVNPMYEVRGELAVKRDDLKRFRQLDSKCPGHPEYLRFVVSPSQAFAAT
jgi:hypothetical protein